MASGSFRACWLEKVGASVQMDRWLLFQRIVFVSLWGVATFAGSGSVCYILLSRIQYTVYSIRILANLGECVYARQFEWEQSLWRQPPIPNFQDLGHSSGGLDTHSALIPEIKSPTAKEVKDVPFEELASGDDYVRVKVGLARAHEGSMIKGRL